MYGLMVRDVMKCFLCRAVLAVCVVSLAAGCGRRDAVGEAFSVGDFFEDGAAGIKPAGVTRRPADGGGDDVTLVWCWISGYVSTEGVEADIRAFAREGFKRIVISELSLPGLCGPVRNDPMSEGWWEALRAALAAAAEENIEIGITARPGLGSAWDDTAGTGAWSDAAGSAAESGAAAAERHFNAYVGEILQQVPAAERTALRFVVAGDLPSAAGGKVADSANGTLQRRAEYMSRMAELCHASGLGVVSRDVEATLLCGAAAAGDGLIAAARIVPDGVADNCRVAVSAARLRGTGRTAAEVGCAEMKSYAASPEAMKRAADMAYVQGINFVALTGAVQQATTIDLPGLNTWLFSDLDRNNPWFRHADMLVDYLWRCNMMLSRGERVADVAIPYSGEGVARTAEIVAEAGYDADYVPVKMLAAAEIRDGGIVVAGRHYAAVVCERGADAATESVLSRLVHGGVHVVRTSLSYRDRKAMCEAMAAVTPPDVAIETSAGTGNSPLRYTHRREAGRDIYFLFNGSADPLRGRLMLRCAAQPEMWNPVDGERRAVKEHVTEAGRTSFEVDMAAGESLFIVAGGGDAAVAAARRVGGYPFEYRWDVEFSSPLAESFSTTMYDLKNLSLNDDRRIRFFSGCTTYRSLFEVRKPVGCDRVELVMREVGTTAKVWINDRYVGGVWAAPYRLDVTDAVRNGMNSIRIETADTWVNAIVGMMTVRSELMAGEGSDKDRDSSASAPTQGGGDAAVEADSVGWTPPQLHFVVNTYTEQSPLPVAGLTAGVSLIYYGR